MKKILLFLSFLLMSIGVYGQATLPVDYSFENGKNSLPTGITQSGLGSDYAAQHTPYLLKFDGTGDYLQIQVNGAAQQIIFGVKKAGGAGNSSIQVSGSTNGSTWTNIQNFTINGAQNAIVNCTTSVSINSSYRYFKFTFTKATNGNIGFGTLKICSATAPTTFTVSYNSNGGSGTMSDGTGASVTIANNSFTAPDVCHEFDKWNTQANGNGTDYNPGAVVTSNLTLYAQWKNKTNPPLYTVSFNTSDASRSQTVCGGSVTLPTPTVSSACSAMGWEFAGWSESNSDYSSLKKNTYIPTSDITLYAVYKKSDSGITGYVLVEEDLDDWSGDYLIAYSSTIFADGRIGGKDDVGSIGKQYVNVNPGDNLSGKVVDADWGDLYNITLETITGGYVMKTKDGKYNYQTSNSNGLATTATKATAEGHPLSITFNSSSDIDISIAEGAIFHYNSQGYFRFYQNGGQNNIYLYKKQGGYEYSFNPVCETIHVDTVTLPVDTIRIHINDTYELVPTVLPSNATNKNVIWTSTMPEIATVVGGTVTGIAEGTAEGIVITEDGSKSAACVIIVLGNPNIDIVEWNPDWLKIDIENFTAATATLEDQNTQADIKQNFANELFFSKYFEAGGTNKMLAIYNGTKDTLDLNNYTFRIAKINVTPVNLGAYGNYDSHYMLPNTEILFVHYDTDNSAKDCADDIEGYQNWIEVPGSGSLYSHMNFGGRASIGLYKNGSLIDIIGIHDGSEPLQMDKPCTYAKIDGFNDDPGGFYTYNGDNIKTEEVETNYFLSTNRCMLVRKNTVKDGSNAVTRNYHDGVNDECNDTIPLQFKTLSQEWMGYQIGNGNNSQALTDSTCTGLAYAGHYDYTDYYVAFDTIYEEQTIPGKEDDGYYKIEIPNLDALSCTNLKITVKDASSNVLEEVVKIPIMIKTDATTTDATYFDKKDCDECDVVVLKNKILTVAGTTSANRDMKLYEGAELRVPTSTSYTLNSLALRRENDTVSSLYLNGGTLTVTDKVYFDLYITSDDWHYVSLPGDFSLSNVKFTNGKTLEHKKDYWARHYDGYLRSRNLTGGWQAANIDSTFSAGQGFIFGLDDRYKKKEFRFEFNNSILTSEVSNKTIPNLYSWGCGDENLRPNHKGWNLIGNPYLGYYSAEMWDKIRVDSLVKVMENGHWTGLWELSNDSRAKTLRYAVIPSDAPEDRDAGGYKSVLLDDMKLSPFICFFVQIGGNDESAKAITMSAARRTNKIVARNYQEDEDDELFLRVKVDDWKTGCFISKNFSDKYEPGDDLESRYPIYQSIGGYKLLYSAINDSIIEHGVQVTAPQGTLYLDPKVDVDKFEYIYVNYNDGWFDLLHGETIDIETTTFILSAKRKIKENTTTDIDELKPTNGIYKFTDGKNIYINKDNTIFNIIGSKIR